MDSRVASLAAPARIRCIAFPPAKSSKPLSTLPSPPVSTTIASALLFSALYLPASLAKSMYKNNSAVRMETDVREIIFPAVIFINP